jgi:predicted Ser/Thr protein kinase
MQFGSAVAISGDTLVVCAEGEHECGTGVHRNVSRFAEQACFEKPCLMAGACYVFRRDVSDWQFHSYIKSPNTKATDHFGNAVALHGNVIAVAARNEDSCFSGIRNGQGAVDNRTGDCVDSGSVYLYRFDEAADQWRQQAYIKSPNPTPSSYFGTSVSVFATRLAVGAWGHRSCDLTWRLQKNAGNRSQECSERGAVFLYEWNVSIWNYVGMIQASRGLGPSWFGYSISLGNDLLAVGAPHESLGGRSVVDFNNVPPFGPFSTPSDAINSGCVYLYGNNNGSSWTERAYIKLRNRYANDNFGYSVSLSGITVAVGSYWKSETRCCGGVWSAGCLPASGAGSSCQKSGSVFTFKHTAGQWMEVAMLKANEPESQDEFGAAVALQNGTLIVGAPKSDSCTGQESDNGCTDAGSAFIAQADSESRLCEMDEVDPSVEGTNALADWILIVIASVAAVVGAALLGTVAVVIWRWWRASRDSSGTLASGEELIEPSSALDSDEMLSSCSCSDSEESSNETSSELEVEIARDAKNSSSRPSSAPERNLYIDGLNFSGSGGGSRSSSVLNSPPPTRTPDSRSSIDEANVVGAGAFGSVVTAMWSGTEVAVKFVEAELAESLEREVAVLKKVRHPHVVQFLGICRVDGRRGLVMEYVRGHDALRFVQWRQQESHPVNLRSRLWIARDTAAGCLFLANSGITHGDLALRNVLISDASLLDAPGPSGRFPVVSKVTDFGLSVSQSETASAQKTPLRWTAPEVLSDRSQRSAASDVWAFSCLALELLWHGQLPFSVLSAKQVVAEARSGKLKKHAEFPEDCPDQIAQVAMDGLEAASTARPTFEDVLSAIDDVLWLPLAGDKAVNDGAEGTSGPGYREPSDEYDDAGSSSSPSSNYSDSDRSSASPVDGSPAVYDDLSTSDGSSDSESSRSQSTGDSSSSESSRCSVLNGSWPAATA